MSHWSGALDFSAAPSEGWQPVLRGPETSEVPRWAWWSALGLLSLLATALGTFGYASWSYANELSGRILPGAVIAGVDVGGMTEEQALAAVHEVVDPQLDRPLELHLGDQVWRSTPRELGSSSDAEEIVGRALRASGVAGWRELLRLRWADWRLGFREDVRIEHAPEQVRAWVDGIAESVNRAPVDAALDVSSGWVQMVPDQAGQVLDTDAAVAAVGAALEDGTEQVALVVHPVTAAVPLSAYEQVLLLRQREHRLFLYQNGSITHSWVVATGTGDYPTPVGTFQVTAKRYMPTWVNPSPRGWGKNMPARIGPGRNNPLGVRALNWSASGIRFHGTAAVDSLGRDASHGCVRLSNGDVVQLYDLVRTGTTIVSLR